MQKLANTGGFYTLEKLGFTSLLAKIGIIGSFGSVIVSKSTSDETKKVWAAACLRLYRGIGIKSENLSDRELKKMMWDNMRSVVNITFASPVFYGMYHLIHPSGLPLKKHVTVSALKGVSGTLAAIPPLLVLYGSASVLLPLTENYFMNKGYEKKSARDLSQGVIFLGAGSPVEFSVEAIGCGLTPSHLRFGPAFFGTVCITGRLAAGVLLQFRALSEEEKATSSKEMQDFLTTLFGTSIAQHGINASMKAMGEKKGINGVWSYFRYGSVDGKGGLKNSFLRVAGTILQRVGFTYVWNTIGHKKVVEPSWVNDE